ncbi:MAG: extracellular solute-binding protein [Patescibacteria group bacterium]
MNFFKKPLALLLLVTVFLGAGCGGPSKAQTAATKPVSIKIWRTFDSNESFGEIMAAYQAVHRNVSFEYRQLRTEEYKDELLHAFAEGKGPDIFSIHNTWIGEYENLIQPMPKSVQIGYSETRGSIKKETVYVLKEEPTMSMRTLKSDFVDVVTHDVVRFYKANELTEAKESIFALPLSVDTLALYYNKDLLNAANIPEPPTTWTQFQEQVPKLTRIGQKDNVIQSGAAIGTSKNVERASDILNLLMLQNGVKLANDNGISTFTSKESGGDLAEDAVRFYTDFANPLKQVYTWNGQEPNSFEAFANGKTAFFFGYSYHAPLLKARSPKLNWAITPMPQIEGGKTVNYANYWVETVAKSSDVSDWAWDFIQFATSKDRVTSYLKKAQKPPARRALINDQLEDETLSTFASQTLTAQSWYLGKNAQVAEQAFLDLIDQALKGEDILVGLSKTEVKVNQTL